jgi:hypothetical protein
MTGFRAGCREQAGFAMALLGQWMGRFAPKGNVRMGARVGCLILFPLITLFVWTVQAIVWIMVALPILTYAVVLAVIGGGFHRGPTPSGGYEGQPAQPPKQPRSRVRTVEDDARPYIGRDGGM